MSRDTFAEVLGVERFTAIFNANAHVSSGRKAYFRAFIKDAHQFTLGLEFANPEHAFTQAMLMCGGMDSA